MGVFEYVATSNKNHGFETIAISHTPVKSDHKYRNIYYLLLFGVLVGLYNIWGILNTIYTLPTTQFEISKIKTNISHSYRLRGDL